LLLENENKSLKEAADNAFQILKDNIDINTFFIAKNDGCTVDVLKAENREKVLLEEGFQIDFQESY
jgi:rsbT co-antagonist protein RsbR